MEPNLREARDDPLPLPTAILVRPTRQRLLVAMTMASILLATLLQLDVNLKTGRESMTTMEEAILDIYLTSQDIEPSAGLVTGKKAVRSPVRDEQLVIGSTPVKISPKKDEALNDSSDSPIDPQPARDWHALIEQSAQASVDEYIRQEDARASLWRQTRSVMFQPEGHFSTIEEEPLLTNIRFREPVGVLGLGFTIGSCFIGIPIAGIPVEQRSTAITLVVCRDDSG